MKQFELVISRKDEDGKIKSYDKIEADDMTILLAQFILVVARILNQINEFKSEMDIPF